MRFCFVGLGGLAKQLVQGCWLKPLIVSNEPWSKAICNNAASYVNRSSPIEIAKKIIFLENNPKIKKSIIQNGNSMMDNFPSINKRIKHEIDFLKDVYNKN